VLSYRAEVQLTRRSALPASPSDGPATRTGTTGGPPHCAGAGELRDGMRRGPALPADHRNAEGLSRSRGTGAGQARGTRDLDQLKEREADVRQGKAHQTHPPGVLVDLGAAADRHASWTTVMASTGSGGSHRAGARSRPGRSLTENYSVLLDKGCISDSTVRERKSGSEAHAIISVRRPIDKDVRDHLRTACVGICPLTNNQCQ